MQIMALDNSTNIPKRSLFVLPAADGSSSQVLKTDGSGQLGWANNFSDTASAVTVGKSGCQFTTFTAAITYIKTQSPSSTSPWVIRAYPGIYTENIIIPSWVSIIGCAGVLGAVEIKPQYEKFDTVIVPVDGKCVLQDLYISHSQTTFGSVFEYHTVKTAGSGYTVGDILTFTSTDTASFKVVAVNAGAVTQLSCIKAVSASVGVKTLSGGTGTGAEAYTSSARAPAALAINEGSSATLLIHNCKISSSIDSGDSSSSGISFYVGSGYVYIANSYFNATKSGSSATYGSRQLNNVRLGTSTLVSSFIEADGSEFNIVNTDETIRCSSIYSSSNGGDYIKFNFKSCRFNVINQDAVRTGNSYIFGDFTPYSIYSRERIFDSCRMRIYTTGGVSSATKLASGDNYIAGNSYTLAGGNYDAVIRVDTIGGGGSIATFTVTSAGTGYVPGRYPLYQPDLGITASQGSIFEIIIDKTPGGNSIGFSGFPQTNSELEVYNCYLEMLGATTNSVSDSYANLISIGNTFKASTALSSEITGSYFDGTDTRFRNQTVYLEKELRFYDNSSTYYTGFIGPSSQAANVTYKWPTTKATFGQKLVAGTEVAGVIPLSWSADAPPTTTTIANNQSSAADISGFLIDGTVYRGAKILYTVYRKTSTLEYSECGELFVTYKTIAGTWEKAEGGVGATGVKFFISNTGQISYTSTNLSGSSYVGNMNWTVSYITL